MSAANNFVLKNGVSAGPFTREQLQQMLAEGSVSSVDLAWTEGLAEWRPLGEVIGVALPPPVPSGVAAPSFYRSPAISPPTGPADVGDHSSVDQVTPKGAVGQTSLGRVERVLDWAEQSFFWVGRLGRAAFVVRTTGIIVAFSLVATVGSVLGVKGNVAGVIGLLGIFALYLIAVQAGKRLHDCDHSAGWLVFAVTGLGALILSIILFLVEGTLGTNRFGPIPSRKRWVRVLASGIGVASVLAIFAAVAIAFRDELLTAKSKLSPTATPSRSDSTNASSSIPPERVVEGLDEIKCSLTIPASWTVKSKEEMNGDEKKFSIVATRNSLYLGLITEDADLESIHLTAKLAKESMESHATNVRWSEPVALVIDGRNWLGFTGRNEDR